MTRPSWDKYFMTIAEAVALRSEDPKTKVGAVLVNNNRIISTGYNGTVPGFDKVEWSNDSKHLHVLHAELNCIIYANRDDAEGAALYVTHSPCADCAKIIAAAKVSKVKYRYLYKNGLGLLILNDFGIQHEEIK